jgi:hypothetical protein
MTEILAASVFATYTLSEAAMTGTDKRSGRSLINLQIELGMTLYEILYE